MTLQQRSDYTVLELNVLRSAAQPAPVLPCLVQGLGIWYTTTSKAMQASKIVVQRIPSCWVTCTAGQE